MEKKKNRNLKNGNLKFKKWKNRNLKNGKQKFKKQKMEI